MATGDVLRNAIASGGTGANPNVVTVTSIAVVAKDLIFVAAGQNTNQQMNAVTDNLGNTYVSAGTPGDAGTGTVAGFYSIVTVPGNLTSVSVAGQTSTADDFGIVVGVFAGPLGAVDKTVACATDSASSYACPATGTLAQANELVVAYGAVAATTTNGALSATSPMVLVNQASPAVAIRTGLASKMVAVTTTSTPAFTNSATGTPSGTWGTATFKVTTIHTSAVDETAAASESGSGPRTTPATGAETAAVAETEAGIKFNANRLFGGFSLDDTDGVNWAGRTLRQRFEPSILAANNGGDERVSFGFATGTSGNIAAAYIGHAAASGDAYDFDGAQIQLTFDGGSTTKAVSGASTVNSDYVTGFTYDPTKALIISVAFTGTTVNLLAYVDAGLETETTAWIAAVVSNGGTVSSGRQTTVNNLVISLKAAGLWAKLDWLLLTAAENVGSALVDLISGRVATAVNSPTFTADDGYAFDGISQYIDSGYNTSTNSVAYTQNSSHVSAWNFSTANWAMIGNYVINTGIEIAYYSGAYHLVGPQSDNVTMNGSASSTGLAVLTRTGASARAFYVDGSSVVSDTETSEAAPANQNIFLGCISYQGALLHPSISAVSSASAGGGFDATDNSNYSTYMRTYMTAVGVP
jgi:hypothetical protein